MFSLLVYVKDITWLFCLKTIYHLILKTFTNEENTQEITIDYYTKDIRIISAHLSTNTHQWIPKGNSR